MSSCVDRVAGTRWLVEVAAVVPEGERRRPAAQDRDWLPIRLRDLEFRGSRLVVVDHGAALVAVFSPDFRQRSEWGRKGPGPRDFQGPAAATGLADTVWVADGGSPPQVKAFTGRGAFLFAFPIEQTPVDIARDDQGAIYVAHQVIAARIRGSDRSATAVSVYGPDGAERPPLVTVPGVDLDESRIILPGPNQVRIIGGGDRVAVLYPTAGIADVYRAGALVATARACMPEDLADEYARQRQAAVRGRTAQRSFPLVTDVRLEEDGGLSLVGPVPDAMGRYHIDHFAPDGTSTGSTVFTARYIRLPTEVRFGRDADRLAAFNEAGLVAVFELRDPPDDAR